MYQGVILHSSDVSEWFSNLGKKNAKSRWTTSKYERFMRAHQNWHIAIRSCINIWNFGKSIESLNQKQGKNFACILKLKREKL